MSRTTRIVIFYIFLIVFLVSAPILVLYTAGYRLNFRTGRIERLGSAVFKSKPDRATVTLDGTKLEELTPTTLKLAADEYLIKVTKDGFSSWQKKLIVRSQETTFAEDVVLWREAAPILIQPASLREANFSPDGKYLLWLEEAGRVHVFDLIRGLETDAIPLRLDLKVRPQGLTIPLRLDLKVRPQGLTSITFSPDNTVALIAGKTDALTVLLENPSQTKQWPPQVGWGSAPNTLYSYESGSATTRNLITGRRDTIGQSLPVFTTRGTNLWSIGDELGETVLARTTLGIPGTMPEPIIKLPKGDYKFLNLPLDLLLIHDEINDRLIVLDLKDPTVSLLETIGRYVESRQNRDGQTELLTWTPNELWRSNLDRGISTLLRRQSTEIRTAKWYSGEYVLFSTDREIFALELDDRDERNVTTILELSEGEIADFAITKNGAKLYYAVSGGSAPGLYVRELQ